MLLSLLSHLCRYCCFVVVVAPLSLLLHRCCSDVALLSRCFCSVVALWLRCWRAVVALLSRQCCCCCVVVALLLMLFRCCYFFVSLLRCFALFLLCCFVVAFGSLFSLLILVQPFLFFSFSDERVSWHQLSFYVFQLEFSLIFRLRGKFSCLRLTAFVL